jgi:hypothetical protein
MHSRLALWETAMKKFFITLLTIAALSGAVLVTHSSPAAATPPDPVRPCLVVSFKANFEMQRRNISNY